MATGPSRPPRGGRGARGTTSSVRARLAAFFCTGRNATDRELAAMLGASVGSISVYRCQLKKLGLAVASPRAPRGSRRRSATASPRIPQAPAPVGDPREFGELNQVLVRNARSELGRIAQGNPQLADSIATVSRLLALLAKLRASASVK